MARHWTVSGLSVAPLLGSLSSWWRHGWAARPPLTGPPPSGLLDALESLSLPAVHEGLGCRRPRLPELESGTAQHHHLQARQFESEERKFNQELLTEKKPYR